jgi:hypothetical protein
MTQSKRFTISVLTGLISSIGLGYQSLGYQSLATTSTLTPAHEQNRSSIDSSKVEVKDNSIHAQNDAPEDVGIVEQMPYPEAREILIQQGWRPNLQGEPADLQDSAVRRLFELGYEEIKSCSGTGEAPCRFEFVNDRGKLLAIVTTPMGDNGERLVRNWWIEEDRYNLPFIGTRYFNFLGGTGTGQTITIEADGMTTVQLHGTQRSSVQYQGQFSNPIRFEDGSGLLLIDGKIYRLSPGEETRPDCSGEEAVPCEATLYEAR